MKSLSQNRVLIFITLVIVFVAFLLRAHVYLTGNFLYLLDQARDLSLVKEIVVNKDITLIGARSGIGGIFHGPLWLYMLVPSFLLSGGNPFYTLIPVYLLISILIILVGIIAGTRLYDAKTGILFGILLSISSMSVSNMANFSNAHVMPLIFLLYLISIIYFLRGKERALILSSFLIGVGIHFEVAFAVFLIPLTLLAIVLSRSLPSIKTFILSVIMFVSAISTYLLFELKSHFLMTSSVIKLFSGNLEPIKGYEKYSDLFFRIGDRVQGYLSVFNAPMFAENNLVRSLILGILLLALFTLFIKKNNKHTKDVEREYLFLLMIPLVIYFLLIFYSFPLWIHYTLPLYVSTILAFVLALKILADNFREGKLIQIGIPILLLLPVTMWIITTYSGNNNSWRKLESLYKDQKEIAEWIFKDSGNRDFGYLVYTPQDLTYQMDYLMWYEGTKHHDVLVTNDKQRLTYLILYKPEHNDKGAQVFWKDHVIHTKGKILQVKKFKYCMSVEKLQISEGEQPVDPNYFKGLLFR